MSPVPAPSAAKGRVNVDGIGSVAEKGNVLAGDSAACVTSATHASGDFCGTDSAECVVTMFYHGCYFRRIPNLLWRSAIALVQGAHSQLASLAQYVTP